MKVPSNTELVYQASREHWTGYQGKNPIRCGILKAALAHHHHHHHHRNLVKAPRSMHAGPSTGVVQSHCIWGFLLGGATTFNSLRCSSLMAPMGNGTAEYRSAGIALDLGQPLSQARTLPASGTTQRCDPWSMSLLRPSPLIPQCPMTTKSARPPFMSSRHSISPSSSSNRSVKLKSRCLRQRDTIHSSCG